jgi:hypothetical protein
MNEPMLVFSVAPPEFRKNTVRVEALAPAFQDKSGYPLCKNQGHLIGPEIEA